MTTTTLSKHVHRGSYWQTVVVPKYRRNHRRAYPTECSARLLDVNGAVTAVDATLTPEKGIWLILDETETLALADGEYVLEVTANPNSRSRVVAYIKLHVDTPDPLDLIDTTPDPILDDDVLVDIFDGGSP